MRWRRGCAAAAAGVVGLVCSVQSAQASQVSEAEEIRCLALNIYHEARGESDAGRRAVAAVTLNRVQHPRYPSTVCAVVWQRGQFSWTQDGRSDKPRERKAWQQSKLVAQELYDARFHPLMGRAIYFHSVSVRPHWAKRKQRVARVGRHVFYR